MLRDPKVCLLSYHLKQNNILKVAKILVLFPPPSKMTFALH